MPKTAVIPAYRTLSLVQGSPEWLAARREHITASEIGAVCGVWGALSSPYELWLRKVGVLDEIPDNPAMRRGRNYEDLLRRLVEERAALTIQPMCVENVSESWIMASLDALSVCEEHFWEFKIPGMHTHLMAQYGGHEGLLEHVEQYYAQTQWQHLCLGNTKTGHFASAVGGESPIPFDIVWPYETFKANVSLAEIDIPIDKAYQVRLQEAGWAFFKLLRRQYLPEKELEKIVRDFRASAPEPILEADPDELAELMAYLQRTQGAIESRIEHIRKKLIQHTETKNLKHLVVGPMQIEQTEPKRTLSPALVAKKLLEIETKIMEGTLDDLDLNIERLKVPSRPGWKVSRLKEDE